VNTRQEEAARNLRRAEVAAAVAWNLRLEAGAAAVAARNFHPEEEEAAA
jgi:hypothetical protein